jgi:hypothetical protein
MSKIKVEILLKSFLQVAPKWQIFHHNKKKLCIGRLLAIVFPSINLTKKSIVSFFPFGQ